MRKILLLILFLSAGGGMIAFGQSSLSERLTLQTGDLADRANITIYPNPADTYIGLNGGEGVERIVMFNMVGRQMKNFEAAEGDRRYFIGDLPRGMYLVQIVGKNEEVITTKRVNKR